MSLLILYLLIALLFSFLCSIAEAVILSVTPAHIALMEKEGHPSAKRLHRLKQEINRPLAAILTLNTIAHTIGAAGAGAEAAALFGSASVGIVSALLTLLILVFSEIIPKTIGAYYWRELAPATAQLLRFLVWLLHPFVLLSEAITTRFSDKRTLSGMSRSEFQAISRLSEAEGQLSKQESTILNNLLRLHDTRVSDAMTPRPVIFSLSDQTTVETFFHKYDHTTFSRIPIYSGEPEQISGFIFRSDILLAQARGNGQNLLSNYRREIMVVTDSTTLSEAFDQFLRLRTHMMLVVDEYGSVAGILTLEDLLETLLGLEIVDESDKTVDMQQLARSLWRKRAAAMGLDIEP
jgi:CBS domain containing-hemolysin-like protein